MTNPQQNFGNQQPGESADAVFTPEQALGIFNRGMEDYWNRRGFTMPSQPQPPSQPSAPQALAPAPPVGAPYYSQAHSSSLAPYHLLPQQGYVAKRRYQPQAPIVFRTTTTGYLTLLDAMNGQLASLIDGDATVFTDDNLSQKQSIRLEIVGVKPYEKQINVRNPANPTRSISRSKLAEKIAKEIFEFMKRQPTFGDPALGPGAQGFERLVLIDLVHVSRSSWQPILGVIN